MVPNNLVRGAIFCSIAIGMGFSLMLIPNIELITVVVFISGLYLGIRWGGLVGFTSMAIYSGMNPMGSGLIFPPLFALDSLIPKINVKIKTILNKKFIRLSSK